MTKLLKWYSVNKKKLHPLVLASHFHAEFEKIPLRYDGQRTKPFVINAVIPHEVHNSIESKITAMRNEIIEIK